MEGASPIQEVQSSGDNDGWQPVLASRRRRWKKQSPKEPPADVPLKIVRFAVIGERYEITDDGTDGFTFDNPPQEPRRPPGRSLNEEELSERMSRSALEQARARQRAVLWITGGVRELPPAQELTFQGRRPYFGDKVTEEDVEFHLDYDAAKTMCMDYYTT